MLIKIHSHIYPTAFKTMVIETMPKNDAGKVLYEELGNYSDRVSPILMS